VKEIMNTQIEKIKNTAQLTKNSKSTKLKGFTLLELIVVLAIIAVLVVLAMMNMMRWIGESRTKNANSDAKLFFNSVQTVVQDYNTRNMGNESTDGEFKNDANIFDEIFITYDGTQITNFTIYNWAEDTDPVMNNKSVNLVSIGNAASKTKADNYMNAFLHDLTRYYSDARKYSWTVYIQKEIVVEAVCSEKPNWKYNGSYPYEYKYNQINDGLDADVYGGTDWTPTGEWHPVDREIRYNSVTASQLVTLRNLYVLRKNTANSVNNPPFRYEGLASV
jgi:prepilin-type N-terminal cleavage/methylation domain-containing protein